jgi:hypothetical protein
MRWIQSGIIIGITTFVILACCAIAWTFFNWMLGPIPATVAVTVITVAAVVSAIVDWKTEKVGGPHGDDSAR